MELKPSPGRHQAEDAAWFISVGTRQGAREADACMASDDWPYEAPHPPPAPGPLPGKPRPGPPQPPKPDPAR